MLFMCCSHASRVTSRGWGNFVLPTPVADDAASFLCACCFASSASRAFAALASRFASVAALYATAKVPGGGRGSTESKQYNVNAHIFELKSARSSDRSRGEGERREKEGRKKGERREKEGRKKGERSREKHRHRHRQAHVNKQTSYPHPRTL